MMDACTKLLNELIDLISDDAYQLHDDERIKRIDGIYDDMEGKVALTKRLIAETWMLSGQRTAKENDIDFSDKMK